MVAYHYKMVTSLHNVLHPWTCVWKMSKKISFKRGNFLKFPLLYSKKIKRNSIISIVAIICVFLLLLLNNGVKLVFARQIQRFNFLNPCERIYSDGNQVCNGYIAINNGGLFGKGLGNSTQKYLYLPEAYTDFIFAIIVEELGLIVSIVLLILMFLVFYNRYH